MGNKIKKTLKNLLYGVPIAAASFLPMKEAKGQMTRIENLNMKRINRQTIKIRDPNTLYLTFLLNGKALWTLEYLFNYRL